jgi:hypothetical protein
VLLFTEAGLTGHSFAEQILGTEARLKVILIAGLVDLRKQGFHVRWEIKSRYIM